MIALFLFTGAYGRTLDEIKRSGKIYVAFSPGDLESIDYDLALEFARYLNVELIEVHIEWDEAFMRNGIVPPDLETNPELSYTPDVLNKADIICSTFTIIEWRKKLFGFAETMLSAELLLINSQEETPKTFEELANKRIAFQGSTTFEQHLRDINSTLIEQMELVMTVSTEVSKQMLVEGSVYGIILDADEALTFNASQDQQYKIAFPISDITRTAWALEKNNPLIQEVENFFEAISGNGVLDELFHKRFGITYNSYVDQLSSGQKLERYQRDLDEILASRKLVVALRERDFIYHENGTKQFMHALAEEFAEYLGVSLEFVVTSSFEKYWQCDNGYVIRDSAYCPDWFNYFDLAAEIFSPMEWRNSKVNMVPVYPSAYTVVARKEAGIESLEDLKNFRGVTAVETIYEDVLKNNGITNYYYEQINNFIPDVLSGKADYTILFNTFTELSVYPELEEKFDLGSVDVNWALRKDQPELQKELEKFLNKSRQGGLIGILIKALRGNSLQSPEAVINNYYESFQTGQLPYVTYGANSGLPQEDIFSIFQDQKGYMWFGTNSGAVRYNGREMQVFNHDQGLPGNSVRDIAQDSSGIMYFATTSGIAKFSGDSTIAILWEGISFHTVFIDSQDKRWFIGDDGIYQESADGRVLYLNEEYTILPKIVNNICEDPGSQTILLATIEGVFSYDPAKMQLSHLSNGDCYSLYIDVHDSIWISTRKGLIITHLPDLMNNEVETSFHNLNERLDFPVTVISDIIPNRFGSVWLVADSRIMRVISTDLKPTTYEQDIGIMNNKILSFLIDNEDNIWIGFSGGLQRLSNRIGLRNFYPGTINSFIYSVFEDERQRMWITSDNGIYYFNENQLHNFTLRTGAANSKSAGMVLPNGNILLADSEGLSEVSSNTLEIVRQKSFPQIAYSVENIFVSSKGEIFLLTGINGSIYYCPDFYSPPRELKNKYTANIFQLIELNGEVLGGNNAGFVSFNGEQFELEQETECSIWSLYMEGDDIWVGTDCGIGLVKDSRFDQMELTTFDRALMIKSILPARNRSYLWLGTNKGFSYFNMEDQKFEFTI
ncbi:MAG: transporter substrate-binding domain-containing protein, partial [Bacteroidales bacterium]|nr:transporter substrate-binding domain-containing protein [Bacteroidales bacterium]